MAINDVLLLLVRGTNLSVVPDPSIAGSFIGDLKSVTIRQALGLILRPLGLDFTVDGGVIHVFRREPETRLFAADYLAAERAGEASIGIDPAARANGSYARVTTSVKGDVFADIAKASGSAVQPGRSTWIEGRAIRVTVFPERLDRVGAYLEAVSDRVLRQADRARVVEVELGGNKAATLDWTGLRQTRDREQVMAALAAQGTVTILAAPRLVVLNNEPAIVRTETVTIAVTPQIAEDSVVTLSLSPLVGSPQTLQADMIARVSDGETIVVAGFGRDQESREKKSSTTSGGWFGHSTVVTKKHRARRPPDAENQPLPYRSQRLSSSRSRSADTGSVSLPSPSHAGAFALQAIRRREGFVVTGDIGTGKTTLRRALLAIDRRRLALVLNRSCRKKI